MDKNLIKLRLDSILAHIEYIKNDVKDMTLEEFEKSDLHVRGVCFSIAQIGEQLTKLESIFGEQYPDIPWKQSIKLRTLIVHIYNKVDAKEIYNVAKNDLASLEQSIRKIQF